MSKPFKFTYTKLADFEECGLKHYESTVLERADLKPTGEVIDYGNRVHTALENALKNDTPLPGWAQYLQYWVDWVKSMEGEKFIEAKWGLTREHQPNEWHYGPQWLRLKADVVVVGPRLGVLIDWKTGNRKEDPLQLWLGAACVFARYPHLEAIDSMFVWLKEYDGLNTPKSNVAECISAETIMKHQVDEIWEQIGERIEAYENALATGPSAFIARTGKHCRWCRVGKKVCIHSGTRQ